MPRASRNAAPVAPRPQQVDPRDLHWAMHAIVTACSQERYARFTLPGLPSTPANAWSDGERPRGRPRHVPELPIFGPLPARRAPARKGPAP